MNQLSTRFAFPPEYRRFAIGFDDIFDSLANRLDGRVETYPPYNIIKLSDSKFNIELAVAGFRQEELTVSVKEQVLTIKGESTTQTEGEFIHHGISSRTFTREFNLAEYVEVIGAEVKNGLLVIKLEKIIPESKQPKLITIETK